jgi:gamma-glutamylcyclotransferase (GGCT)/AIG2-like uncharacterized protein YtfP
MNAHLFVYGSLMSTAGHRMGARLRREAGRIGPASIQGRLYRVSWYPGAVDSADPAQRVHGEVYALSEPQVVLAWLDAYEGIVPGRDQTGEYRRVERPVRLATGAETAAWVYLYQKDVTGLPSIPDGRWRAPGNPSESRLAIRRVLGTIRCKEGR